MMKSRKQLRRMSLSLEPALQIIYLSAMSISFCLSLIFATTIQTINVYTILFLMTGIALMYFKRNTYLTLTNLEVICTYFGGIKKQSIRWDNIQEIISYYPNRRIEIKGKHKERYIIYLNQANQRNLLSQVKKERENIDIRHKSVWK